MLPFLRDWQTLIAGGLAFIPAAVAVFFVWRQSNDQRRQFFQLHQQQAQKARLRLGGNLSRISQTFDTFFENMINEDFSFEAHYLDTDLIESVLEVGAITSGKTFANIRDFVALTQQYTAKCSLYRSYPTDALLAKLYRELAILDFMVDNMYAYARFESEDINIPKITIDIVVKQLSTNLRRNKNINDTNLEKLLANKELFELT